MITLFAIAIFCLSALTFLFLAGVAALVRAENPDDRAHGEGSL